MNIRASITTKILERPELESVFDASELYNDECGCHICSTKTDACCTKCSKPTCIEHLRFYCPGLNRICPNTCNHGLILCLVCIAKLVLKKG